MPRYESDDLEIIVHPQNDQLKVYPTFTPDTPDSDFGSQHAIEVIPRNHGDAPVEFTLSITADNEYVQFAEKGDLIGETDAGDESFSESYTYSATIPSERQDPRYIGYAHMLHGDEAPGVVPVTVRIELGGDVVEITMDAHCS